MTVANTLFSDVEFVDKMFKFRLHFLIYLLKSVKRLYSCFALSQIDYFATGYIIIIFKKTFLEKSWFSYFIFTRNYEYDLECD